MPAWATVTITLGSSLIAGAAALAGAWLQNKYAEKRRREDLREQRTREAADMVARVMHLIEEPPDVADYDRLQERWMELRPSLLSFALAHPSPEMQELGERLVVAVMSVFAPEGRSLTQRTRASELAREMVSAARRSVD